MTRCGVITFLGLPNVGKSSLTNRLVGEQVSIVTRKVQTTRTRIRGIAVEGDAQMIFTDTPGVFEAKEKDRLGKAMVAAALEAAEDADIPCHVIEAKKAFQDGDTAIQEALDANSKTEGGKPAWLVVNKCDELADAKLMPLLQKLAENPLYAHIFPVSAESGRGCDRLLQQMAAAVPEGEWLYPDDDYTDQTERLMAAEITREVVFDSVHDEIPYGLDVETQSFETFENQDVKISQVIWLEREAHKRILIGKGGGQVKVIRTHSQKKLEDWLQSKVHLYIEVKVDKNWKSSKKVYTRLGLNHGAMDG